MSLFQNSVITKYVNLQNKETILNKWSIYKTHFLNPVIQENIRNSKEEQYQGEFLIDLFVNVLGYTKSPTPNFNLITEIKNEKDSKKADGGIIVNDKVIGVIELKGTNSTDFQKIEVQAFGYKNNQKDCLYVITSNFEKLRFYIDNAIDYEEFNLFSLTEDEFKILYLCLAYENILQGIPKKIKEESLSHEDLITKQLYKDYSLFKRELFQNLTLLNPQYEALELFKKSQKLLDRFLFLYFAEDRQLLPPNSVRLILNQWVQLKELDEYKPLYDRFKKYFGYLNTGFKGKQHDIFAYNGGLFRPDDILDNIIIDDDILYKYTLKLSGYDFSSEVDVNILGHIFENSLNELDEIKAQLEGNEIDKTETKRKKEGVFYTPKYITKYIVENTVGKLCTDKKNELQIIEEDYFTDKKRQLQTKKNLLDKLTNYRNWLLKITIVDPACGSGAFLNEALNFLIAEHKYIDELEAKLLGGSIVFPNIENSILENNLFGVDINEESVEIAKLSLWLRTAQPNRKLNDLSNNIKCGNSLIDDSDVAGDKAFCWEKEFPTVFKEKQKKVWHVTWVTHDTRTSERMKKYRVRQPKANGELHIDRSVYLEGDEAIKVTEIIQNIVVEEQYNCLAYNICNDHVHMLLVCDEEELSDIVRKLKGKSAQLFKEYLGIPKDETFHLWAQKFDRRVVESDEYLKNAEEYIFNNREKHCLLDIGKGLQPLVQRMICTYEHAFRTEYKGGFDVVIGNPPYGAKVEIKEFDSILCKFKDFGLSQNLADTYFAFFALSLKSLLNFNGYLGYITPNTWRLIESAKIFRNVISTPPFNISQIIQHIGKVFKDATVDCDTIIIKKNNAISNTLILLANESNVLFEHYINQKTLSSQEYFNLFLTEKDYNLKEKIQNSSNLMKNCFLIKNGTKPYEKGKGKPPQTEKTMTEKPYTSIYKIDESFSPLIGGSSFHKYKLLWNNDYWIKYGEWLAAPRDKDIFEAEEKLIFRQTADTIIGQYITKGFIMRDNTHIVLNYPNSEFNLKYVLALMNSKLIDWLYWTINPEKGEAMAQVKAFHLGLLSFKELQKNAQKPFIEKADIMLTLNKDLQDILLKFRNNLVREFGLDDLPTKLQNWHLLSYPDFLKEIEKKKVKLTLSQKAEWEEYFNTEHKKANEIKSKIVQTDKMIDQMVYELYGLTEEEIEIVEQNTK